MRQGWKMAGAIGLGAVLLYVVRPQAGRGGRLRLARRVRWALRRSRKGARMLAGGVRGGLGDLATRLAGEESAGRSLERRVRARVAPLLAFPADLETRVEGSRVVLSGPVRPGEVDALLAAVWRTRGVREVDVRLELYEGPAPVAPAEDARLSSIRDRRPRPGAGVFRFVAVLTAGSLIGLALRRRAGSAAPGGPSGPLTALAARR